MLSSTVKPLERRMYWYAIKIVAVVLTALGVAALCFANPQLQEMRGAILSSPLLSFIAWIGFCISAATALFYAWLTRAALRYRPIPATADCQVPVVTVVVPAYNEGALVFETLASLVASDYPAEKLQLIAVDDGSQDDTWHWIQQADRQFPGRIVTIRQMKNGGKRRALYEGFTRASGEILVTVDSDSIVNPDTLRHLVSPFVSDVDCGAVAGNVRVWNTDDQLLPKMLDVSFVFSFEFIRSAQSYHRTVLCTPGALAAYRRDLVMNVLTEWLEQRFLGHAATIGEDRALTNLILRQGKSVLFQSNAIVYTKVPSTYRNLCKMFIRWGRSNVRENFRLQSFAFRGNHRGAARLLAIMQQLWSLPSPLFYVFTVGLGMMFPLPMLIIALTGVAIWSSLPALVYCRNYPSSDSLWSYAYGIFYTFGLSWIRPFCLLTMHRSGWLTRTLPRNMVQAPLNSGETPMKDCALP